MMKIQILHLFSFKTLILLFNLYFIVFLNYFAFDSLILHILLICYNFHMVQTVRKDENC